MAELYGDLAEEVSWDDYSIYPRPVDWPSGKYVYDQAPARYLYKRIKH
jgi:hypothetical protein